jgi:hypothetical protein
VARYKGNIILSNNFLKLFNCSSLTCHSYTFFFFSFGFSSLKKYFFCFHFYISFITNFISSFYLHYFRIVSLVYLPPILNVYLHFSTSLSVLRLSLFLRLSPFPASIITFYIHSFSSSFTSPFISLHLFTTSFILITFYVTLSSSFTSPFISPSFYNSLHPYYFLRHSFIIFYVSLYSSSSFYVSLHLYVAPSFFSSSFYILILRFLLSLVIFLHLLYSFPYHAIIFYLYQLINKK